MDAPEPTEAAGNKSNTDGKMQLRDLNYDVIYHICSYLHMTDLIACQFLSKEFWEAATKIFERKCQHLRLGAIFFTEEQFMHINYTNDVNVVHMVTLVIKRVGYWVTALTISAMCHFDDLNQIIAQYCPRLTELDYTCPLKYKPTGSAVPFKNVKILKMQIQDNNDRLIPKDALIKFYINSCPKLEKLTLGNMNISRFNIFCGTQLKELSLNQFSGTSIRRQKDIDINTFSKLELLRVDQCGKLFDIFPQLLASGDNLKDLTLSASTCDVAWICRTFPHLERFDIQVDGSFPEIMDIGKLSKLKKLKIEFIEDDPSGGYESDHWINRLIQSLANRNSLQEFDLSVANDFIQITVDTIEACRAFTVLKNVTVLKRTFGGRRGKDSLWSMCSAIDCLEHLNIVYEEEEWFSLQALLNYKSNLRLGRVTSNNYGYLASKTFQPINYLDYLQIDCIEEEWLSWQAVVENMPNLRSLRLTSVPPYIGRPLPILVINYVDFSDK